MCAFHFAIKFATLAGAFLHFPVRSATYRFSISLFCFSLWLWMWLLQLRFWCFFIFFFIFHQKIDILNLPSVAMVCVGLRVHYMTKSFALIKYAIAVFDFAQHSASIDFGQRLGHDFGKSSPAGLCGLGCRL